MKVRLYKGVITPLKGMFNKVIEGIGSSKGKRVNEDIEAVEATVLMGDMQKTIRVICLSILPGVLCLEIYEDGYAKVIT